MVVVPKECDKSSDCVHVSRSPILAFVLTTQKKGEQANKQTKCSYQSWWCEVFRQFMSNAQTSIGSLSVSHRSTSLFASPSAYLEEQEWSHTKSQLYAGGTTCTGCPSNTYPCHQVNQVPKAKSGRTGQPPASVTNSFRAPFQLSNESPSSHT